MNWNDLNISQKSDLIGMYIGNGITRIADMKKHFNQFADGGNAGKPPYGKVISSWNSRGMHTNRTFNPDDSWREIDINDPAYKDFRSTSAWSGSHDYANWEFHNTGYANAPYVLNQNYKLYKDRYGNIHAVEYTPPRTPKPRPYEAYSGYVEKPTFNQSKPKRNNSYGYTATEHIYALDGYEVLGDVVNEPISQDEYNKMMANPQLASRYLLTVSNDGLIAKDGKIYAVAGSWNNFTKPEVVMSVNGKPVVNYLTFDKVAIPDATYTDRLGAYNKSLNDYQRKLAAYNEARKAWIESERAKGFNIDDDGNYYANGGHLFAKGGNVGPDDPPKASKQLDDHFLEYMDRFQRGLDVSGYPDGPYWRNVSADAHNKATQQWNRNNAEEKYMETPHRSIMISDDESYGVLPPVEIIADRIKPLVDIYGDDMMHESTPATRFKDRVRGRDDYQGVLYGELGALGLAGGLAFAPAIDYSLGNIARGAWNTVKTMAANPARTLGDIAVGEEIDRFAPQMWGSDNSLHQEIGNAAANSPEFQALFNLEPEQARVAGELAGMIASNVAVDGLVSKGFPLVGNLTNKAVGYLAKGAKRCVRGFPSFNPDSIKMLERNGLPNLTPRQIESNFNTRMGTARNNLDYVEPQLVTREYKRNLADNCVDRLKKQYPDATQEEIMQLFQSEYGCTYDDLLGANGLVYRDKDGTIVSAGYSGNIFSKTHEWNHTGFNYSEAEILDETMTTMATPYGSTKAYLNEKSGFASPNFKNPKADVVTEEYMDADEMSSFCSELLSILGKTKQNLTGGELKWLSEHRKEVIDILGHYDEYTTIFDRIIDFDKAAKWINNHATVLAAPIGIGLGYNIISQSNNKDMTN